jgi:hypothetical protein
MFDRVASQGKVEGIGMAAKGDKVIAVRDSEAECFAFIRSHPRMRWDVIEPVLYSKKWRVVRYDLSVPYARRDWDG